MFFCKMQLTINSEKKKNFKNTKTPTLVNLINGDDSKILDTELKTTAGLTLLMFFYVKTIAK